MAEIMKKGPIVGWETAKEIYAEEVVGINVYEQTAIITLAVNRVEPGKASNARSVQAAVVRLVLPFATANALVAAIESAAKDILLADTVVAKGDVN